MTFFLILAVRGPFHKKDFKQKQIRGYKISFYKEGSCVSKTYQRGEPATSSYSANIQYIYTIYKYTIHLFCACG